MKTNKKVRRPLLSLCLIASFVTFVHGQDNRLIYSIEVSKTAEKVKAILQRNTAHIAVDFVKIELGKIPQNEQFILQFAENNIIVDKKYVRTRGTNYYYFVGSNNGGESISLSILNDDIQGVIETTTGIFSVETIGKDEYAIIKVNQSKLKENCEHIEVQKPSNIHNSLNVENVDSIATPMSESDRAYSCKIRILVLYTPGAKSVIGNGDIKNTILMAVDLTNQSLDESNIYHNIELVYIGQTNYIESGSIDTDLYRFRTPGTGHMEEVHALRNKYSADICVLLTDERTWCGIASGIGVNESNAFCVVASGVCATTNYSFGHEIGHLLGARHDRLIDPTQTPFAFGHGYVHPSYSWRTIMAYPNTCPSGTACRRVKHWSNPDVSYYGPPTAPTGTTSYENNARVWNEQSNRIKAFRQPVNTVIVTNGDVANSSYGNIIAKQNVVTDGIVNVGNGSHLSIKAGNSITLAPGLYIGAGVTFSATIENVYDCW